MSPDVAVAHAMAKLMGYRALGFDMGIMDLPLKGFGELLGRLVVSRERGGHSFAWVVDDNDVWHVYEKP